jgi:hypothetical protein
MVVDQGISGGRAVAEAQSILTAVGAHAGNPNTTETFMIRR